jgi:hypothetical protein
VFGLLVVTDNWRDDSLTGSNYARLLFVFMVGDSKSFAPKSWCPAFPFHVSLGQALISCDLDEHFGRRHGKCHLGPDDHTKDSFSCDSKGLLNPNLSWSNSKSGIFRCRTNDHPSLPVLSPATFKLLKKESPYPLSGSRKIRSPNEHGPNTTFLLSLVFDKSNSDSPTTEIKRN